MDSVNRTLVLGLSGLAALVWLAAMLVALFFFQGAVNIARDVVAFLAENSGGLYLRLMFAAIFAVLLLVSVLLMLVAYSPSPSTRAIALPRVPGGIALLTPEAIAQYLTLGLADLPGVTEVRPQARSRSHLVDISLDVHVLPGVDLVNMTAQVQDRLQRTVSQDLGLGLGRLRVFYYIGPPPQPRAQGPITPG